MRFDGLPEETEVMVMPGFSMSWRTDGRCEINGFRVRRPYRLHAWLLRRYTQTPGSHDKRRVTLRRKRPPR